MPTLDWLNRDAAFRTAAAAPTRVLRPHAAGRAVGDVAATPGNLLVQGDNLDALKALLPFHRGRVKCIFIDPPYNTKSAFEHDDDNLQHSQWLSMMLPRLQLLQELLREDGSIWVTIDDNERALPQGRPGVGCAQRRARSVRHAVQAGARHAPAATDQRGAGLSADQWDRRRQLRRRRTGAACGRWCCAAARRGVADLGGRNRRAAAREGCEPALRHPPGGWPHAGPCALAGARSQALRRRAIQPSAAKPTASMAAGPGSGTELTVNTPSPRI